MRRNTAYIHQLQDWPNLHWDGEKLASSLALIRHQQGRLIGRMEGLGFALQQEATLQALTEDAVKSSAIEGETLDADLVRSSVARHLGMDAGGLRPADRRVDGVVDMVLDATAHYDQPLTAERLFGWHASLFPGGGSGKMIVGGWRNDSAGPMQVVSGPMGRERVHFEAPDAGRLDHEMGAFLEWFNTDSGPGIDAVLKAALAHLWFVTIHPFDDGNGRIARATADLGLARSEQTPRRFYSMSAQIREERAAYYAVLEATQCGTLDITPWMDWFLACLGRATARAQTTLASVLAKARFWEAAKALSLNDRQRLVLNRILDGFEGHMTTSKWAAIAKCSSDTALRDILELVEGGLLTRNPGGGRSTSYSLSAQLD